MKKIICAIITFCCAFVSAQYQERVEILEEVVVMKQQTLEHDINKRFKGRKYFTYFHNNQSLTSVYKNEEPVHLVGFKLEIDASGINPDDLMVFRPVILFEDLSKVRSFEREFNIDENTKEVIFSFSKNPIKLEKGRTYFIGIEITSEGEAIQSIKIKALNKKGTYSMLKVHSSNQWFKQENSPYGYNALQIWRLC